LGERLSTESPCLGLSGAEQRRVGAGQERWANKRTAAKPPARLRDRSRRPAGVGRYYDLVYGCRACTTVLSRRPQYF
jgi:hypothetical protein